MTWHKNYLFLYLLCSFCCITEKKKKRTIILFALMVQKKSWSVLNFYIPLCGWYLFHMNKKAIARIKNNEIPVITARDDRDFPFWASFSNPVTKQMSTVFSLLFCTVCYNDTEKHTFWNSSEASKPAQRYKIDTQFEFVWIGSISSLPPYLLNWKINDMCITNESRTGWHVQLNKGQ